MPARDALEKYKEINLFYNLAETLEKRDSYTGNHTKRVMNIAIANSGIMGFDDDKFTRSQFAAVLYDIGKIALRDNLLLKNTGLDSDEINKIEKHTVMGKRLSGASDGSTACLPASGSSMNGTTLKATPTVYPETPSIPAPALSLLPTPSTP